MMPTCSAAVYNTVYAELLLEFAGCKRSGRIKMDYACARTSFYSILEVSLAKPGEFCSRHTTHPEVRVRT